MTRPGSPSCRLALCPLGQRRRIQWQRFLGQAGACTWQHSLCSKQEQNQVLSCLMKGLLPGFPQQHFNLRGSVCSSLRLAQQKYGCNNNKLEKLQ